MLEWPIVTVLVCTYNRPNELLQTLDSLDQNLMYPPECIKWVIADDCSNYDVGELLSRNLWVNFKVIRTPQNSGWGANVNNAMKHIDSPYIFFTEDDYILRRSLDLIVGVALMECAPRVGMLRYFGPGGDVGIRYDQKEANISAWLPEYRDCLGLRGKVTYLEIAGDSDSLWIYSNRPHLKRADFHGFYGDYPQGKRLGATEESYAHTVKDGLRAYPDTAPQVAVLPAWIPPAFDHIGQTYQLTEADK